MLMIRFVFLVWLPIQRKVCLRWIPASARIAIAAAICVRIVDENHYVEAISLDVAEGDGLARKSLSGLGGLGTGLEGKQSWR
jgi:hypothetical protein